MWAHVFTNQEKLMGLASFWLMLLFMGLFYQVAWQYPVVDSFPLIERLMDPQFLSNDFYTNTFSEFSPRLALAQAVVFISEALDIHYTQVIGYANILRIWFYGIALYLLFLQLSNAKVALAAFTFSALSFLSMPFLPAWWPITFDLTASNVALVFAMFAWVMSLKDKIDMCFILLSCAVYVHPLVGVQSLIIAILIYLAYHGFEKFIGLFKQPSIYVNGAIFGGIFLFIYSSFNQTLSDERFVEINGIFRHGHHFIFSHMDIEKWICTLLMIASCIVILIKLKPDVRITRTSYAVIGFSGFMTLLGFVFVELIPTRFMVSFIPMRAFSILVPIVVLSFALLAVHKFYRRDYVSFAVLFLPFLPYHKLGLTWYLLPDQHELVLPLIMTLLSLGNAILTEYHPSTFKPVNQLILRLIKQPSIGMAILPIAIVSVTLAIFRFDINIPNLNNDVDIYRWINDNTQESDLIVAELNAASNQKIRLMARRAVVVSKDFPFNEKFYEQWYQRYSRLYIERDSARGHLDTLSEQQLNRLLDDFSATILIRTKTLDTSTHFELIGQAKGEEAMSYIYRNKLLGAL
ncbi:MAG: DUF6798 domain-containing protein [Colwellia sp.]|jgi:hypothetical protein